jgi:predicted flap endonuclease-1-like 5' DNA nuclease
MNLVFSSALGWVVAVAIAIPIVAMFWWARRNAPVGDYETDYSMGRRSQPPAEHTVAGLQPVAQGATDAPVPANPAALAPPTETVAPPASTTNLPAHAPMPPEPPTLATTAPAAPAATVATPEPPVAAPTVAATPPAAEPAKAVATPPAPAAPAVAAAPKAPAVAQKPVPEPTAPPVAAKPPEPKPQPPAPVATAKPIATPAPASEPAPMPEPAAVVPAEPEAALAPAAEASAESADDFSRLYGIDAAARAALQGAGIVTYRQLAAANVDHLREILAGIGQSNTDPVTWPQQGRFAAGGKWKILDARFKR